MLIVDCILMLRLIGSTAISVALVSLLGSACQTGDDTACGAGLSECHEVAGGRYLIREPAGWDGQGALPMLLYFHPYGSSDTATRSRQWIAEELDERGILGVFPNGIDNTWAHEGSPSKARDELAFLDAVLADVESRYTLSSVVVSGFSQGGSMAWDAACYRGDRFEAVFPIAGAFWEPLPDTCPAGPVVLRHTHGLADGMVPMEGRPIGNSHQGDVLSGIAVWRSVNGCAEEPDRTQSVGSSTCQIWSSCSAQKELSLCLHGGGHEIPNGWFTESMDWALSQND